MPPEDIALQAYLASIVESSDDAIIGKSLDGIVMSWNRAAERIFGYTAEEMIGRPMSQLAVPGQQEDMTWILDRVRNGERIDHYETVRQTKDGRVIFVSLCVSPIRDNAGKIVGASKIARDITERKRPLRTVFGPRNDFAWRWRRAGCSPGNLTSPRGWLNVRTVLLVSRACRRVPIQN